jgi:hypothetical protein
MRVAVVGVLSGAQLAYCTAVATVLPVLLIASRCK